VSLKVGTAGWTISAKARQDFPDAGSSLERYSSVFPVVEINSSFHRPHRISTWERWRDSTPNDFRFSVKIPKEISHQRKLISCEEPLAVFLEQVTRLGEKLAVLLIQLPPKLEFNADIVGSFLTSLLTKTGVRAVCEPRNETWFTKEADILLKDFMVARVAADPAPSPGAAVPGGWLGMSYWRLHGSPHMYRSSYADRMEHYAKALIGSAAMSRDVWCIFDNTASSAAIDDALLLRELVERGAESSAEAVRPR
jgi:uncharacterized protein YecE (DUF72 family)